MRRLASKLRLAIQPSAKRKATAVVCTLISIYNFSLFLMLFVNEAKATDFDGLGTMMLGGFALAVAVAVLMVFVKLRYRAKHPEKAEYLSISNISDGK